MLVTVEINNPIYRDYLNHLFTIHDGHYLVSRTVDFGKSLCSRVRYSTLPVAKVQTDKTVVFELPKSRPLASAKNQFLFFNKEDQLKLNEELSVLFNIDFDRYYLQGLKMGIMQKDIIEAFIVSRRLDSQIGNTELLKKRQYRNELELLKKRTNVLLKKAIYRNQQIESSLSASM